MARLRDGSGAAMATLLRGFDRLGRLAPPRWMLRSWPEVLRCVEPAIRRRLIRSLRRRGADAQTEELGVACLYHARESLAGAFRRIDTVEFASGAALLAALHLHAELAMARRLAPYDPTPLPLPAARSRGDDE